MYPGIERTATRPDAAMNDAEHRQRLITAARELAAQGLTAQDVDQALKLPPGMAAGLIADPDAR
jgi:hypothetical protein